MSCTSLIEAILITTYLVYVSFPFHNVKRCLLWAFWYFKNDILLHMLRLTAFTPLPRVLTMPALLPLNGAGKAHSIPVVSYGHWKSCPTVG